MCIRDRSILRILAALFFLEHGLSKFFGFPAPFPYPLSPLLYGAGVIETVGGVLLALGAFTRPAAFLMSGEMAVAYFMTRPAKSFYPLVNGGELEALYCLVFLYFVFAGGGPWSLDRVLMKRA